MCGVTIAIGDGVTPCAGTGVRRPLPRQPGLPWPVSGWIVESILPPAVWSVFFGGLVVFQGTPHWEGDIISFLGHVFSSSFLLGLSIFSKANEIIVTCLPLNYHGRCSSFPTCAEEVLWGTWQPHYLMAPESGFPRSGGFPRLSGCARGWTASQGPARSSARGSGQRDGPPGTRLAHTDQLWFVLSPPPEYKKKYGEEHGSCQAGTAGFFTKVGVSPAQGSNASTYIFS